jgi:ribosomal-protein-alanine N-acetyltransferase
MNAVLDIERASFEGDAYPESLFRLHATHPKTLFLLAKTDGIAGYIIARRDRWGAEIVSLAVDPRARRQGIARKLLTTVITLLSRDHARSIRLMVRAGNITAAKFYRHHGFRAVGRVAGYYEDGEDGIRMRLDR